MQIFEFSASREFVRHWLAEQPRAGRGLLRAWSSAFHVHPTLLSQVLTGRRLLTPELAELMSEAMELSEGEAEFLLLLVQWEQAGLPRLKKRFQKKIDEARAKARLVSSRVKPEKELGAEAQAKFYSSWIYSGIRNLTAIPRFQSVEALAQKLGLPKALAQDAVDFLVAQGLCRHEGGKIVVGEQRTFVSKESPLVQPHHQNWRGRAVASLALKREQDFFLTVPMSLSEADAERVRALLLKAFEEINKIISPSNSETGRCLNIDFFEF